ERESLMLMARYFGGVMRLRRNHPRVVPEAAALAHLAMENCGLIPDLIVDEDAPAYPPGGGPAGGGPAPRGHAPRPPSHGGRGAGGGGARTGCSGWSPAGRGT